MFGVRSKSTRPNNNLATIFLVLAMLGLIIRIVNMTNPDWDGLDEMNYALVARSLMSGGLPYHGAFDHKPIALYYIFALFFQVFGYTLTAIRLMPFVAIGFTSWFLFGIAKKQLQPQQHYVAFCAILFMATCASFGNTGQASNTEILQMPVFAAWWLAALNNPEASWRRPLLMGALAAVGAQINYLGGFVLVTSTALILAWPLLIRPSRPTFQIFLVEGFMSLGSFLAAALIILTPLIAANDLPQYFRMQYGFLSGYPGHLNSDKLVRAGLSILISAIFFLALIGCIGWHERSFRSFSRASVKLLAQLAFVVAITLFSIGLTKRLYPHYFNLLIVPSTLILLVLLASASERSIRGFTYLAGIFGMLLLVRGAWDVYLKDWHDDFKQRHEIAQLVAEIRHHAQPDDRVLLLNMNHTLYFLTDVTPATRFVFKGEIFMDRFLSNIGSTPEEEVITAVKNRPVFVMVCFDDIATIYRPTIENVLAPNYRMQSLTGYNECRNLRTYSLIKKSVL